MNRPIKVLHVVGAMNRAGTETMLMNIFRNIDKKKFHFDFVSYSQQDGHYDNEIRALGGRVIKLSNTQSIGQLIHTMKEYGPYDVVHSHTLFQCGIAMIAAKMSGVKVRIAHAHTTFDNNDKLIRRLYMNVMRKTISTLSTNTLSCSERAGRYLYGKQGIENKKYRYFPNLIDFNHFLKSNENEIEEFKKTEQIVECPVIGHIGRFMDAKNHKFIIEIMECVLKRYPEAKLLLVGEGELRQETEALAIQKGIKESIRFLGVRKDITTILHSMDVFLFPSIYEGLGLVLLEAQAAGLPCIVSEAIPPEADIGLGLIQSLSLRQNTDIWAQEIIKSINKKERNTSKIVKQFEKLNYSIPTGIKVLTDIYETETG